ncbi:hypothetical protein OHA61_26345 [Streptomyces sp. NBC_00885]|uniref:hypothetical protein n=1 Tax=Streptomyces sp. NBC_00885 TaxID=2975857 RepID=UPI0038662A67|nr:hypothetical protein OHA61_26345 [Streptomyces sp. NBC_00885]
MGANRKVRRLVVGDTIHLWSVRHRHQDSTGEHCAEVLSLGREGTQTRLRLVFRAGPGRLTPDAYLPSGTVADDRDHWLNLHEPGVVRRFVDEAEARGVLPADGRTTELDGWPLFDAVVSRNLSSPLGVPRTKSGGD